MKNVFPVRFFLYLKKYSEFFKNVLCFAEGGYWRIKIKMYGIIVLFLFTCKVRDGRFL